MSWHWQQHRNITHSTLLHSSRRQTGTGSNTETLHSNVKQTLKVSFSTLCFHLCWLFLYSFFFLIALCNTTHRRQPGLDSSTETLATEGKPNLTATEGKQISPFCCSGVAPPLPLPHLSGVSEAVSLTLTSGAEGCGRRVNQQQQSCVVSQMELSR